MFRPGDQEVSREDFMDSMFRSELMTKCRFFIPPEAAYGSIGETISQSEAFILSIDQSEAFI